MTSSRGRLREGRIAQGWAALERAERDGDAMSLVAAVSNGTLPKTKPNDSRLRRMGYCREPGSPT
jgi:hypothetical protein